jgi:hypothetical protein
VRSGSPVPGSVVSSRRPSPVVRGRVTSPTSSIDGAAGTVSSFGAGAVEGHGWVVGAVVLAIADTKAPWSQRRSPPAAESSSGEPLPQPATEQTSSSAPAIEQATLLEWHLSTVSPSTSRAYRARSWQRAPSGAAAGIEHR